MLHHKANN